MTNPEMLYNLLITPEYRTDKYCRNDLGEDMEAVSTLFADYWKPRWLLDHKTHRAYEFMDENARLTRVADSDIDWQSLRNIPLEYRIRVKNRNAWFPTHIGKFEKGMATVRWQLNPDGRYWMDEDGFGRTDDVEFNIYGFIDRTATVIVPFQPLASSD